MKTIPPIPQKKNTSSKSNLLGLKEVKAPNLKEFNLSEAFKKKIEQATSMLDVPLDPNDVNLIEQLTLGDNWDDPFALTKAMDRQPLFYARWATLLRKLKKERQKLQQKYDVWMSISKEEIQDEIFSENVKSGMTANNAKPTNQSVENRFNKYTSDEKTDLYKQCGEYKQPVDEIDGYIDTVDIIVKAFEQRKDMMISLGSLVRSMIDNQLLIYRQKNKPKTLTNNNNNKQKE